MRKKKFLGQNFLKDKKILREIVSAAEISRDDIVLEAGPGEGTLTEILAVHAKKVVAVEKDRELIPLLKEKFSGAKNVEIIDGDILKLNPKRYTLNPNYKIVANIPYYITSHFLKLFLSEKKHKPELMVLMIQKEVAERICARPPDMNMLALSVQAYGKPEIIRKVSKNFFSPPPKVDSAIIKISGISDDFFKKNKINEKVLFDLLRAAFQKKRKMLRQSIGRKITLPENYSQKRPEELSIDDWAQILTYL